MRETSISNQQCADCGRPLQKVSGYPSNEVWCVHCGNRYYAALGPSDQGSEDKLAGFRVLMLDSDCDRRDRLVAHLTRLGYLVTPVCHPRQAMEAASFRRFDVVVLPSSLPEFECTGFVTKLKHLLGSVRFVLLAEHGMALSAVVGDPDVVSVEIDDSDCHQLERIVERLIDDIVSARVHSPRSDEVRVLVAGVSE